MEQLLWIETLLKGSLGACLLLAPKTCIHLFGLPPSDNPFWPRLLGATLFSLSIIIFTTGAKLLPGGLSPTALAILNLGAATVLLAHYVTSKNTQKQRGRAVLALLTMGLVLLAGMELVVG